MGNDIWIQLSLECPFWYCLLTESQLIYNQFPKAQQIKNERGPWKAIFWSMTLYNKKLSNQCNLIAQIEQVYDIFIYDYTAISACTGKIKGYAKTFALYVSKMIKYPGTLRLMQSKVQWTLVESGPCHRAVDAGPCHRAVDALHEIHPKFPMFWPFLCNLFFFSIHDVAV